MSVWLSSTKLWEAIDKELDKLPYTAAEVKIVLDGKTLICKYTKNKPIIGFVDTKENNEVMAFHV